MALPYAKIILSRLHEELKPRGFKKHGQKFIKSVNDCHQIVSLQASQWGGLGGQRYTLNLAVYSALLEPLEKDVSKLREYDGQWRARIGDFTESGADQWWTVGSDEDAPVAAEEMLVILRIALAEIDGISSYERILGIPHGMGASSDGPPGGCKWHLIDPARIREGIPASVELPYVPGQRSAWHQRHYPDYIAPERKPNPLTDSLMRSRELGKSLPGITLVLPGGAIAPMVDADE